MGDDICGYPTADDTPCQHPTTDDGDADRCWVSAHNEAETESGDPGRDWSIDESDHEDILEAASMGASKAGCARAAGVRKPSLLRYLDAHEDFRTAFAQARAQGEQRLLKGPLWNEQDAPREMDGQHARFLLSTSFDYKKTEKQEVEDVTEGGFGGDEVDDATREVVREALADRYDTDDA